MFMRSSISLIGSVVRVAIVGRRRCIKKAALFNLSLEESIFKIKICDGGSNIPMSWTATVLCLLAHFFVFIKRDDLSVADSVSDGCASKELVRVSVPSGFSFRELTAGVENNFRGVCEELDVLDTIALVVVVFPQNPPSTYWLLDRFGDVVNCSKLVSWKPLQVQSLSFGMEVQSKVFGILDKQISQHVLWSTTDSTLRLAINEGTASDNVVSSSVFSTISFVSGNFSVNVRYLKWICTLWSLCMIFEKVLLSHMAFVASSKVTTAMTSHPREQSHQQPAWFVMGLFSWTLGHGPGIPSQSWLKR